MQFKHMEIKDLNNKYNLDLAEEQNDNGDFYEELLKKIDESNQVGYFSASFEEKDVVEDIEEEQPKLNLALVEIDGVYLALY